MDREILEWISKEPQDWWQKTQSTVYTWGKGSWNQLGTSTRENSTPALAEEWKDVQQVCRAEGGGGGGREKEERWRKGEWGERERCGGGGSLGGVCDHIKHLSWYIKGKLVLKTKGATLWKRPRENPVFIES